MAHHIEARYDEADGTFLPPLRTLGFNPQLTMNDSLLVQSYIEAYDRSMSASYVELPVMLAYSAMEGRLRLAAGVAPAVRVAAKVTNGGAEDRLATDNFEAFDWLPITASVSYLFTDHLGIEGRYQNSMLSVTKENGSGTYRIFRSNTGCFHNLITIGLTYRF